MDFKKAIKFTLIFVLIIIVAFWGMGYINAYFGWYAHEHWKHRKASMDVEESKKRGVFVKELQFKVEGYAGNLNGFQPFIEKAFTWGHHSSEETVPWPNTKYPYRLSFNYRPTQEVAVLIRQDQLSKFDSANASWGFMKEPKLTDTITLIILGEKVPRDSALIKVWE